MESLLRAMFLLLFLFSILGSARVGLEISPPNTLVVLPQGQKFDYRVLNYRQTSDYCDPSDFDDPDVPTCRVLCGATGSSCLVGSVSASAQRFRRNFEDVIESGAELDVTSVANLSAELYGIASRKTHLVKRVTGAVSQGDLDGYVYRQVLGNNPDPNFGAFVPLMEYKTDSDGNVILDENGLPQTTTNTVTVQMPFGDQSFQIGTPDLHGCTVVTVVSKRAVYMGHFFENPAFGKQTQFQQRVINWITGVGTRVGKGSALDPSLFNQNGDDTRIFIMSPRAARGGAQSAQYYRTKLPQLKATLNGANGLLPGAPMALRLYQPLDYDPDHLDNNPAFATNYNIAFSADTPRATGKAVFQFDPNFHGQGIPGWRLFYEEIQFNDNDPPLSDDAAKGVPDLPSGAGGSK
ncbi:uncharacterized protein PAC_14666 [Phialocephala subalpina]|uniref:Uncharacterized protein n=1 Tax=Phialocephala subalpina TaxID=576137 RepID=A0A1L7XII2_9HELO|nr:uncharacterized protein PAC_14666 [Phialocephala subalpina]